MTLEGVSLVVVEFGGCWGGVGGGESKKEGITDMDGI